RAMAQPMPRRGMLKMLGAAAAAGVGAVVLKPFRADAACNAGDTPCGTGCCPAGVACVDPSTARCGCPAGSTTCGSSCCSGTCRTAGATCFYNKQCCSPMTCSCHNEGYSVCC